MYDPGASARGETPGPRQTAETRSRSGSKQAQQSWPRFRMMPRGVRLLDGRVVPALRASRTEEKNGKSGSTHEASGGPEGGLGVFATFGALTRGALGCAGSAAMTRNPQSATNITARVRAFGMRGRGRAMRLGGGVICEGQTLESR